MMRSGLTKSTVVYSAGNFFVRSVNFLLLPLYSNVLSPADFGSYALLISFYSLVLVLYHSGYQSALTKFYLEERDSQKQKIIFSTITTGAVIIAFILSLLIILFSANISVLIFSSREFSILLVLISAALFLETAGARFLNLMVTRERAKKVAIISGAGAVFNFIMNIVLVYFMRLGVEGIIIAQVISAAAVIVILLPFILNEITPVVDKEIMRRVFVFVLPLTAAGILTIGVDVADRFILNYFLGREEVGIYSFAYRIALVMNLFVVSFRAAWMPYSIRHYHEGNYSDLFGGNMLKYTAAAALLFLSVFLLAGDLFDIRIFGYQLFSKDFSGGIQILPLVLGGYFFTGIISFYSIYPFIADKPYHFIAGDGIAFAVNLFTNFILIPIYGITGAAAATLLSYAAGAIYLRIISGRHIRINLPAGKFTAVIAITAVLSTAGSLIGALAADILFIAMFTVIMVLVLKIRLSDLFPGKTVQEI